MEYAAGVHAQKGFSRNRRCQHHDGNTVVVVAVIEPPPVHRAVALSSLSPRAARQDL